MLTLIVSDSQATATNLREALAQHGHACAITNVISVDSAAEVFASLNRDPDLVLFVPGADTERTLKVLRELRTHLSCRLLAVGPKEPDQILSAIHAGADDYLDETGDLFTQLSASLSRARATNNGAELGRMIVVCGAAGGSGCSVIATNLALLLAHVDDRSCLLDLDMQRGSAASLLNLRPRHTIADLCRNIDKLDFKMFEQSLLQHESGVHVLASPRAFDDSPPLTIKAVEGMVRMARSSFANVVIDLPGFSQPNVIPLIQHCPAIVLVTRLDFGAIRNSRRALDFLERHGIDKEKIHLVANRCGQPKELAISKAEKALRFKISHRVPEDPKLFNTSVNCGVPFAVDSPKSKPARAIGDLASVLSGKPIASARTSGAGLKRSTVNSLTGKLLSLTPVSRETLLPGMSGQP